LSYLNPAEEWERLQVVNPHLASMILMAPRSIVVPPPGVDARDAYTRVFAGCISAWLHMAALGSLIGA
jgi:hypothetical protein